MPSTVQFLVQQTAQPAQPSQSARGSRNPQEFVIHESAVPRTGDEVKALRIKIEDLKGELQNAAERRSTVASRLREADIDARQGYIERLQALDNRILAVENEITVSVAALSRAPAQARLEGTAQMPDPAPIIARVADDLVPIVAIFSVFVFGPIAIAMARLLWKRATNAPRVAAATTDHATQQKLDQLQQAVDTIAIEVERISEGQRFVTRIMSDRALGAGAAEPVRSPKKSAVPSERG
jgi:hypothetical protein